MDTEERRHRGSLTGPVILIGLGIVFLLNNLDILPWSVWSVIVRLWPVLLIAAGLDLLIGRRSIWGSLLALLLVVTVLVGAVWLFQAGVLTAPETAAEEIRQALDGATQAEIRIGPATGRLHVESLPESGPLIEGVIHPTVGEQVKRDFSVKGEVATFALTSEGSFGPFPGDWGEGRGWELALTPDVPLELEISLGVGKSDLDLSDLSVSNLDVSMGIGKTTVFLPDEGDFQAQVESAIGKTVIVIPDKMATRIRVETGLGTSHVPEDYRQQGDVYVSPDFESADHRVELDVSQAIGSITIEQSGDR